MSTKHLLATFILTVATTLGGCNRHTVYSHYESTGSYGWGKLDVLRFTVGPVRESAIYEEQLGLRLTDVYPYDNLAVIVERHLKPSGRHYCDTVMVNLANDDGRFTGQGNSHYLYHVPLPNVLLSQEEQMQLSVRHCMQDTFLPGITDVGIIVVRSGK